jgi:hypothetical protein
MSGEQRASRNCHTRGARHVCNVGVRGIRPRHRHERFCLRIPCVSVRQRPRRLRLLNTVCVHLRPHAPLVVPVSFLMLGLPPRTNPAAEQSKLRNVAESFGPYGFDHLETGISDVGQRPTWNQEAGAPRCSLSASHSPKEPAVRVAAGSFAGTQITAVDAERMVSLRPPAMLRNMVNHFADSERLPEPQEAAGGIEPPYGALQ